MTIDEARKILTDEVYYTVIESSKKIYKENKSKILNAHKTIDDALNRLEELEKENADLKLDNDNLFRTNQRLVIENTSQEKVLKIIKEKGIKELSVVEDMCNWNWDDYVKLPCSKLYTKSEFELLKEHLK